MPPSHSTDTAQAGSPTTAFTLLPPPVMLPETAQPLTLKSSRRILVLSNMSQPAGSSACFFILCSQGIFHMSVQGVQSLLPFSYSAGLRGRSYTGTADIDSCA